MSALDESLRNTIRQIVREELDRDAGRRSDPDAYLSTIEAAAIAGVAEGTIRRWIREARIPGHRAGRVLRVRSSDLHRLLAGGLRATRAAATASPEDLARQHFGLRVG